MPFSIVHIEVWTKLTNNFYNEKDYIDFLAWSIFVDCSYTLAELWVNIDRSTTHFYNNENYFNFDFTKCFKNKELSKNNSFFNKWYYCHLILDKVWRDSNFVWDSFNDNIEKEKIYQISRFLYAHNDLNNFLKESKNKEIINKLYKYTLDKNKIPSIFYFIDDILINKSFKLVLDYMLWKKTFNKIDNSKQYYENKNWKIQIIDSILINDLEKLFPVEWYTKLKKVWLCTIKCELDYT